MEVMFPHVNLCPLLERHLRGCAETKGLITPDAARLGRGGVRGGEGGSLGTAPLGSGQLLCAWWGGFFIYFFSF